MSVEDRLSALEAAVKAMHEADDAYGCGFYGEDDWRAAYKLTRSLVGMSEQE